MADFHPEFNDDRLPELLLHYKARNFPRSLSESEQVDWESWRASRIEKQLVKFAKSIEDLSRRELSDGDKFVLDELRLWVESIAPEDN